MLVSMKEGGNIMVARYSTPSEMLARERQMMGRAVEYVNCSETIFRGGDGVERRVSLLVYRCEPTEHGEVTIHESRFAVYVDGIQKTGGVA